MVDVAVEIQKGIELELEINPVRSDIELSGNYYQFDNQISIRYGNTGLVVPANLRTWIKSTVFGRIRWTKSVQDYQYIKLRVCGAEELNSFFHLQFDVVTFVPNIEAKGLLIDINDADYEPLIKTSFRYKRIFQYVFNGGQDCFVYFFTRNVDVSNAWTGYLQNIKVRKITQAFQ